MAFLGDSNIAEITATAVTLANRHYVAPAQLASFLLSGALLACTNPFPSPERAPGREPPVLGRRTVTRAFLPDTSPGGRLPEDILGHSSTLTPTRSSWRPSWREGDTWLLQEFLADYPGQPDDRWMGPQRWRYEVSQATSASGVRLYALQARSLPPIAVHQFDLYFHRDTLTLLRQVRTQRSGQPDSSSNAIDLYNRLRPTLRPAILWPSGYSFPVLPLRLSTSEGRKDTFYSFPDPESSSPRADFAVTFVQRVRIAAQREWMELILRGFPVGKTVPRFLADGERVKHIATHVLDSEPVWLRVETDCYIVELGHRRGAGQTDIATHVLQVWCPDYPWPIYIQSRTGIYYLESYSPSSER